LIRQHFLARLRAGAHIRASLDFLPNPRLPA
jgi:hypothetical protein